MLLVDLWPCALWLALERKKKVKEENRQHKEMVVEQIRWMFQSIYISDHSSVCLLPRGKGQHCETLIAHLKLNPNNILMIRSYRVSKHRADFIHTGSVSYTNALNTTSPSQSQVRPPYCRVLPGDCWGSSKGIGTARSITDKCGLLIYKNKSVL